MANFEMGGGAVAVGTDGPGVLSGFFNWMGAIMSVALIAGLGLWGYRLAMRDVSGVPVVRALEGPMRIAPDDPGGAQAAYQGLAVNSVAADGGAAAPADRLVLAPEPLDLTEEDRPRPQLAAVPPEPAPAAPPDRAELLALDGAVAVAEEVTPLSAAIAPVDPVAALVPASVGGVSRSPFPRPRPGADLTAEAVAATVALSIATETREVDPASVAVGTRLVQFGAYDSPEAARAEWAEIEDRFADFLRDKQRIVQESVSGGKTFWRLRAMGFADIDDARRFCSALLAARQACIPVVVR